MKTRYIALAIHLALLASHALVSQPADQARLDELDKKIARKLNEENWHEASKAYIRAIWNDFKAAYIENKPERRVSSIFSRMPDVRNYDEYLGKYVSPEGARSARSLEITKSPEGRFIVKLEGHDIPAVCVNGSILFTTGDVVYSYIPEFAEKPYAQLEFFIIVRLDKKYYFISPGLKPDIPYRLLKIE